MSIPEGIYARLDYGWSTSVTNKNAHSWADLVAGINDNTIAHTDTSGANSFLGSAFNDFILGAPTDEIIDGAGGNDYIGGNDGNDTLIGGTGTDKLLGGKGNDTLIGGYEWGETINGGEGIDTASFDGETSNGRGVYVRLSDGWATSVDAKQVPWLERYYGIQDDTIAHDDLIDIENIIGSKYSDAIGGDDGDNVLHGGAGGNDWLGGGKGIDTASYEGDTEDGQGLVIKLSQGWVYSVADQATRTWTEIVDGIRSNTMDHDKLGSIENTIGSIHNDKISGNNDDNVIEGREGNDFIGGGKGNDTIIGGAGSDKLYGNDGDDKLYADEADRPVNGGSGFDRLSVEDSNNDNTVTIDLTSSQYAEIEAVVGDGENGAAYNVIADLDDIAINSQPTDTYDNTFAAIGIDTLTLENSYGLGRQTDISGVEEANLIAALGLDEGTDLHRIDVFASREIVSIITDDADLNITLDSPMDVA